MLEQPRARFKNTTAGSESLTVEGPAEKRIWLARHAAVDLTSDETRGHTKSSVALLGDYFDL